MFVARVFIAPAKSVSKNALEQLASAFADFFPAINQKNNFVEFQHVTRAMVERIEQLLTSRAVRYDLVIEEKCTDAELADAKYVPLLIDGDFIDADEDGNPLNTFTAVKCRTCLIPAEDSTPTPYTFLQEHIKRRQDAYLAHGGILLASKEFISCLGDEVVRDVCCGEAKPVGRSTRHQLSAYFWLRPKFSLGRDLKSEVRQRCLKCGAPIEVRETEAEDKFLDAQIILESFGDTQPEIALLGNWYGYRTTEQPFSVINPIFVSGGLCRRLLDAKIRGVVRPASIARTPDTRV